MTELLITTLAKQHAIELMQSKMALVEDVTVEELLQIHFAVPQEELTIMLVLVHVEVLNSLMLDLARLTVENVITAVNHGMILFVELMDKFIKMLV